MCCITNRNIRDINYTPAYFVNKSIRQEIYNYSCFCRLHQVEKLDVYGNGGSMFYIYYYIIILSSYDLLFGYPPSHKSWLVLKKVYRLSAERQL